MPPARESSPPPTNGELSPADIYFSNLNVPPVSIATMGVQALNAVLDRLREGEDGLFHERGIEVTPTRRLLIGSGLLGLRADVIHQPWALSPIQAVEHSWQSPRKAAFELAVSAIMPAADRSLPMLSRQSRLLGGVPAIVFGDQRTRGGRLIDYTPYNFAGCETQISPELVATCSNGEPFGAVYGSLFGRGVFKLVVDTHHIARAGAFGVQRLDPQQTLADVENADAPVSRIHASAGRTDVGNEDDRRRSMADLKALIEGRIGSTAMGDTMAAAYGIRKRQRSALSDSGPDKIPVTIEIPYDGLCEYRGSHVSKPDFIAMHKHIAYALHDHFASLTA